jgi:predicted HTH transcriptional regulator
VHQGRTVPTVGERFLFGHGGEHGRHVLEVWIQAGRFAGTGNSRIVDRIEIHSFPVQTVGEAIAFRQKHSWPGAEIGEVRGIDLSTRATRTQLVRLIGRGLVRAIRTSPKDHHRNDVSAEAPPDEPDPKAMGPSGDRCRQKHRHERAWLR